MSNRNPIILIMTVLFCIFAWMFSGCTLNSPNRVVIDKGFLDDINKAFEKEANSGKDQSEIYNMLWKQNYYELMYLAALGDKKAINVSISLIGQKNDPARLYEEIEPLVKYCYENIDEDPFWILLSQKPKVTQVKALHIFNYYKPIDWCMEHYFEKHPDIKISYEVKYGKITKEEEGYCGD